MRRRVLAFLFALLLVSSSASAKHVFFEGESEPFDADAHLLTLYVFPLMGADSMLLTLDDQSMLIDMGTTGQVHKIESALNDLGYRKIGIAFNTHPHNDHLGGMLPLLKHGFVFDSFFTVFPPDMASPLLQRWTISELKKAGIPIHQIEHGDLIPFGDARVTILRQTKVGDINSQSGMLMIEYGDCRILLSADVEADGQRILTYDIGSLLNADILKYPHHGMSDLAPEFLDAVAPELVFFTNGSINTIRSQKQLIRSDLPFLFATWGTIVFATDGHKWIVSQQISEVDQEYIQRYNKKLEHIRSEINGGNEP